MFRTNDTLKFSAHEVHLWQIPLTPDHFREESLAIFSKPERERAAGFVSEALRLRWCVGRAALRTILARYLACSPDAILFRKGEHGKPTLPRLPLHFNLSHSGDLALLALTRDVEVGIDLEFPAPERPFEKLIERFFSSEEAEAIRRLPPEQLCAAFYRCWTRKEALLKGVGTGISLPLKSFSVGVEDCVRRVSLRAASNLPVPPEQKGLKQNWLEDWILYALELPAPYCGALALRDPCRKTLPKIPMENLGSNPVSEPRAEWELRYFEFGG